MGCEYSTLRFFPPSHVKKQELRLIAKHNLNSISSYEKGTKMAGKLK